jgi:hypothetical protein
MIDKPRRGARLLFRVDPIPLESPRGYFCRVASAHGYASPQWLVDLAGFSGPSTALDPEDHVQPLAHVLRLEPKEWLAISYRPVKETGRFAQRAFCGQTVRADQFNYRRPRICPGCLRERPLWWAVWDLGLVAACPFHRCLLINQCPACGKKLVWRRPAVERCRCGTDLRGATAEAANADLVVMNTLIYRAAGFSPGTAAELQLGAYHFPSELGQLALGPLLRLIRFMGLIEEKDRLRRKQRPFPPTDLTTAIQAGQAATAVLRDWPQPLREVLQRMLPPGADNPAALKFSHIFGNFYRHLFHVLPRSQFGFLHDVFERFVIDDWKGLVRGQHRHFSADTRQNSHWMTASEAERMARTNGERILDLVRQGQIEGIFLTTRRGGRRTECWIRRESLNQWTANRDAELTRYMSRPEARRALGLTNCTIVKVAAAGAIRYVEGPEHNFPAGFFFFLQEDVMKIKQAFEKHAVSVMAYSGPGKLIALRHAMKNYLGRDSGLAAVIQAVVEGTLIPVGYTKRFRGITGYLFVSDDLRKYRPVPDVKVPPEGFLNYREAASVLGVKAPVIGGMVAQGILSAPAGYRPGASKLVPAGDVQRFAERYVAATVVAERFNLSTWSFTRYLQESGRAALAVPIPEEGKRPAFFILNANEARLSSEALPQCKTRDAPA